MPRARARRTGPYDQDDFNRDLIQLQDTYIEFLQTTILGMLFEMGADLHNAPLHLLEPRELEVSLVEEDDNILGNDYLTRAPRRSSRSSTSRARPTSRTQLAIPSLIPPNDRILAMRAGSDDSDVDLEHVRKQIQKETLESNRGKQRYMDAFVSGAFSNRLLELATACRARSQL